MKKERESKFNIKGQCLVLTLPSLQIIPYKSLPEFPKILKSYTKAAIRTQPYDLLLWSASYFRCLANGEVPPIKERIEYPVQESGEAALTPGLLRILHKQIGGICLSQQTLENILNTGNHNDSEIDWDEFLIDATISMCVIVINVMEMLCDILTNHPEGISNYTLPDSIFLYFLTKVARKFDVKEANIEKTRTYLINVGANQGNILSVSNIKSPECPLSN
ncbi:unnamed protein product [Lepeophtheirus salmonis]|uniref:(salmon louse) hypothetical protein n=1 Tax=Lepeophtheirus salmonis TaxID=72036 RepID=A0A7R8D2W4_LEPSM|nr:unnamed protein product [Lepeophtheirus salmonis]CAF3009549.1 unnamed protein product [Lepeophtheirus salmonis]